MSYSVQLHAELPIVEAYYVGHLTAIDLSASVADIMKLLDQHNLGKVFADCREITGGHTMTDLYEKADEVQETVFVRIFKEAVLLPRRPDLIDYVKFWEMTCQNRGMNVQAFNTRQECLYWLMA